MSVCSSESCETLFKEENTEYMKHIYSFIDQIFDAALQPCHIALSLVSPEV